MSAVPARAIMKQRFPNTERTGKRQLRAVVAGLSAPKGLGKAGYEPLMQNRMPDTMPAASIGLLPATL